MQQTKLDFTFIWWGIIKLCSVTRALTWCGFCQDSNGVTCPFCRCEIRSTEQIVVDPFHKTDASSTDDAASPPTVLQKYSSADDDDSGNFEVVKTFLCFPLKIKIGTYSYSMLGTTTTKKKIK